MGGKSAFLLMFAVCQELCEVYYIHYFMYYLKQVYEVVIIPILQMKLGLKDVKYLLKVQKVPELPPKSRSV